MTPRIESVHDLDPATAKELGFLGKNPAWTCVTDPRFSYHLYIPWRYYGLEVLKLVVLVHGSGRDSHSLRDGFASFAEEHSCAVLAPLFPMGLEDPQDTSNYKSIEYRGIRYDHILLSMIDEVKERFGKIQNNKFLLFGFSGGGQFVHRFAYLHPDRLHALACGAPGTHTRIDYTRNYPLGVKDFESIFGQPVQWETLKTVPTMFIVGDADTDTFYLSVRGYEVDDENKDGRYRAIMLWEASWKQAGGNSCFVAVSGAKHEDDKMWPSVKDFFSRHLLTLVEPALSPAPLISTTLNQNIDLNVEKEINANV